MTDIKEFSNDEIVKRYLKHYRHSEQSVRGRKSALNYFFKEKYFGYDDHIGEIETSDLIDYFEYLNNKPDIALATKQFKWHIIRSLVQFSMEYYDNFLVALPSITVNWKPNHKEPNSNADVVLDKAEVNQVLDHLRITNFKYYLIFRLFAESGLRKGELISIDIEDVNLRKRYVRTKGKRGRKVYYITREYRDYLRSYRSERLKVDADTNALFLSKYNNRFSDRSFNDYLDYNSEKIGVDKNITCQVFRRTLNTLRKVMGCPNEDRKILLNHKVADVNINHYVKLNYEQYISLYDRWNPYKDISF